MLKKTARFLFCVRPGTSPTRAFYSGFFAGAVLTYHVVQFLGELEEERKMRERFADAFTEEDREIFQLR